MKIKLVHRLEDLAQYRDAWDRLESECGPVVPEQTYAVSRAFLAHKLPAGADWTCLLALEGQRLVAVLTLIHGRRFGLSQASIQLFKTPFDYFHTESGAVLIAPGRETVLVDFVQALRSAHRCIPVLGLLHLPADGTLPNAASRLSGRLGSVQRPVPGENFLKIQGDFTAFQQSLQAKFRRELHRRERRLGEHLEIRYRFDGQPATNLENLRLFLEIENSGWKGSEATSIIARHGDEAFFADATEVFAANGQMDWGFFEAGDQAIAGQLVVRINRRLFLWKVGYREDYATYAPSNLLLYRYLETVCGRGDADELSFQSDRGYQREFKPAYRGYLNLILFPHFPGLAWTIRTAFAGREKVGHVLRQVKDRFRTSG
jgi:CelD/BcsL family acetyltransferase involved in cellulose biosynthesis